MGFFFKKIREEVGKSDVLCFFLKIQKWMNLKD